MRRPTWILAVLAAAAVLVACDGDDGEPVTATTQAASTATTAPSTETTRRATTTTLPDSGPVVLESAEYPYALAVMAEDLGRAFVPATSAWDGRTRVIRDTPFLDRVVFVDGVVHVLGIEWADDLEALVQMFVDHGAQHNGCSPARNQRDVTVGGAPALVFTVDSCGVGGDALSFARIAALHDGFGLIAFSETRAGQEDAAMERLLARLSGLEWRTG